ncbi:MAG: aminotransferase class IV family protein [Actinobacteria bacterium]|nr:aminotransferase class IV family protein [Actinomycetota bacterium]
MTLVWLHGEVLDATGASVPVLDHGLTVGDGVFETLKVVRGGAFALGRHLARLRRSASALGLDVPLSDDSFRAAAGELICAAAPEVRRAGKLRITVTAGPGPLGSARDDAPATVVLAVAPLDPWPPTCDVVVVPWTRNERSALAGVKSTSYAENVVALRHARSAGAGEALFRNTAGALCEGTGSNVFLVRHGALLTPSLATGCLAGITRELLVELLEVTERDDLTVEDLRGADEVFLTSSTRDVQGVGCVDGNRLAGAPGDVTAMASAALLELQDRTLEP